MRYQALTRRPCHRAPSHQMQVNVEHGLPCLGTGVDNGSISSSMDPLLTRQVPRHEKQVPCRLGVRIKERVDRFNMPFGNDECVARRLWISIFKCEAAVVFKDDLSWKFSIDDPAKNAIRHGAAPSKKFSRFKRVSVHLVLRSLRRGTLIFHARQTRTFRNHNSWYSAQVFTHPYGSPAARESLGNLMPLIIPDLHYQITSRLEHRQGLRN